jgi:hypothetical protein
LVLDSDFGHGLLQDKRRTVAPSSDWTTKYEAPNFGRTNAFHSHRLSAERTHERCQPCGRRVSMYLAKHRSNRAAFPMGIEIIRIYDLGSSNMWFACSSFCDEVGELRSE